MQEDHSELQKQVLEAAQQQRQQELYSPVPAYAQAQSNAHQPTQNPIPAFAHQQQGAQQQFSGNAQTQPTAQPHNANPIVMNEGRRKHAAEGWRGAVATVTRLPVPKRGEERKHDEWKRIINRTLRTNKIVAVITLKGGAGATTTTVGVASVIAEHRKDGRVCAADATRYGTLHSRVAAKRPPSNVRALLAESDPTYGNVAHTHMLTNAHRLAALPSDQASDHYFDPLTPAEWNRAIDILHSLHAVTFIDMDPSADSSIWRASLARADAVLVVGGAEPNVALRAVELHELLRRRGYSRLVKNTTVVINRSRADSPRIKLKDFAAHFHQQRIEVPQIPYDRHLAEDSVIDLELTNKSTRLELLKTAALVMRSLPES